MHALKWVCVGAESVHVCACKGVWTSACAYIYPMLVESSMIYSHTRTHNVCMELFWQIPDPPGLQHHCQHPLSS